MGRWHIARSCLRLAAGILITGTLAISTPAHAISMRPLRAEWAPRAESGSEDTFLTPRDPVSPGELAGRLRGEAAIRRTVTPRISRPGDGRDRLSLNAMGIRATPTMVWGSPSMEPYLKGVDYTPADLLQQAAYSEALRAFWLRHDPAPLGEPGSADDFYFLGFPIEVAKLHPPIQLRFRLHEEVKLPRPKDR